MICDDVLFSVTKAIWKVSSNIQDMVEMKFATFTTGPIHTIRNHKFVELSGFIQMGRSSDLGLLQFKTSWTLHLERSFYNFGVPLLVFQYLGEQFGVRMSQVLMQFYESISDLIVKHTKLGTMPLVWDVLFIRCMVFVLFLLGLQLVLSWFPAHKLLKDREHQNSRLSRVQRQS